MKAKSIKGNSSEEISKSLIDSMADGFTPTLAIVFMSIKQDRIAICDLLDKSGIAIFGSTSSGEFIDGEIGKESTVIMLMDINRSYFKILFEECAERNTCEIAKAVGETGLKTFSHPAFMVACDGFSDNAELIIQGIEDAVGGDADIFGGMASDDLTATGTFVFANKNVTDNGLVALIIDKDKIKISGLATHGWQPVGTIRTVTKSEGNVIYTVDGEPALDIFMKYMGIAVTPDSYHDLKYNFGDYYPIQLVKDNAPSIMRETRAINTTDRSIMFSAGVPQGSKFRFSLPPDWEIIDKIKEDCYELKKEEQSEADAVIVFSCASRPWSFGPMVNKEVEEINTVWESPMIGFFTYGEIGKSGIGKNELHNNTCMIVVLKENNLP
jgi:hypothetical protein